MQAQARQISRHKRGPPGLPCESTRPAHQTPSWIKNRTEIHWNTKHSLDLANLWLTKHASSSWLLNPSESWHNTVRLLFSSPPHKFLHMLKRIEAIWKRKTQNQFNVNFGQFFSIAMITVKTNTNWVLQLTDNFRLPAKGFHLDGAFVADCDYGDASPFLAMCFDCSDVFWRFKHVDRFV